MTLALVAVACSSLTVRDDMAVPVAIRYLLYAGNRLSVTAVMLSDRCMARIGFTKKRAGLPRLAQPHTPCWDQSRRVGSSGRRHQHGVDHMDHAVRLVDVRDRDHRGSTLGVDDPDLAVLELDRQLFALGGLELHAVLQVGRG